MNPLWLVAAAIVVIPVVPISAVAVYRWRRSSRERALGLRRKEKFQIVREPGAAPGRVD